MAPGQKKIHTKKTPIKYYKVNLQRQRIILHSAFEKSEDAQGGCVKPILFASLSKFSNRLYLSLLIRTLIIALASFKSTKECQNLKRREL